MPSLRIALPGQGPATYRLYKPITILGEAQECDVVLRAPGVTPTHAHIQFDGSAYHIAELERDAEVYITHLKPSEIELTMQEIDELSSRLQPRLLQNNHVFEF